MKPGAVIVDVAVDQGGCIETIHETTHDDPVYEVHGVLHYAVGNMPGAVPHTSTYALTNATLPYHLDVAVHGAGRRLPGATRRSPSGVNTVGGTVTNAPGRRVPRASASSTRWRRSPPPQPGRRVPRMGATMTSATISTSRCSRWPTRSTGSAARPSCGRRPERAGSPATCSGSRSCATTTWWRCCATSGGTARTSKIMEMQGVTDPQYLHAAADVDPVGRG